jgi:ABC-2 type transport system permease protein
MMQRILTVARRELASYFDHATAYILLVIFLGINFFFFFRDAYLMGEASLRPMFGLLPWLLLFFIPAVSMRSLAEEQRSGTLELVLAQPVSVLEFLLGKFLGVLSFLAVALFGTIGIAVGFTWGADLQWGVIFSQYLGSLFLVATLVAVGLWASSTTRNQVTAFILGVAMTFLLYAVGLQSVVLGLPGALAQVATRIGVLVHFSNVSRGVIDLRDVLYFISVTAAFLALTYFSLMRERLSQRGVAYRRLRLGTLGLVALAIMVSLLGGRIRGRLDLTPGKIYTLSGPTRDILDGLDDLVTIKLFISSELPPEFVPTSRDLEDLIRDFDSQGGDDVRVIRLSPDDDQDAATEAATLGIQRIQFNVFGEEELQVRQGYLGVAIQYAGETEAIPVVQQTRDLEYRMASALRALTRERLPVVGFLRGHGEQELLSNLRIVESQLREDYALQTIGLDSATASIPDTLDVVVIANPALPMSSTDADALEAYVARGGSLFLIASGARVDQQTRIATPIARPAIDRLLRPYGIGLSQNLVFDLRSRANIQLRNESGGTYALPYPLWPMTIPASGHMIVRGVSTIIATWAGGIDVSQADTTRVIPLLGTSEAGGWLPLPAMINPDQDWTTLADNILPQLVAAALVPDEAGGDGRIVLVTSPELVLDDFLPGNPEALLFFQNAVDWLAQDEALISIRAKDRSPPRLLFPSAIHRDATKYGNMIGIPLLFVLLGVIRSGRRRGAQRRSYDEQAS